jgi:hypothetical protein
MNGLNMDVPLLNDAPLQDVARTLDGRVSERLLNLARLQEADGIMSRDGDAARFGMI